MLFSEHESIIISYHAHHVRYSRTLSYIT